MPWPLVPFGDIAEFRNGLNYTRDNHGDGLKVINVGGFGDRFIPDIESLGEINPDGIADEAGYLQPADMLFVRSNGNRELIGRVMYMESIPYPIAFSAFCIRARIVAPNALPKFYAYFFRSGVVRNVLSSIGGGASIANLNQGILKNFSVPFPDRKTQEAIVERLDASESLLANCQQRIGMLEEAARLIYTEWFVRLRFPGCKPNERVDELPNGWRRDRVDSLLTLQRGFDLPADQRIDGDIPIIASTGICGTHSISKVSGPGVVTGRSGTLGKVRLVLEDFWPLNTTLWIKAYRGISPYFAYFLLQELNLASLNVGASVPSLDRNTVHPLPIIVPDAKTLAKFDETVTPIFQQIDTLERQIKQLKSARDLLLPRLISGQLRL